MFAGRCWITSWIFVKRTRLTPPDLPLMKIPFSEIAVTFSKLRPVIVPAGSPEDAHGPSVGLSHGAGPPHQRSAEIAMGWPLPSHGLHGALKSALETKKLLTARPRIEPEHVPENKSKIKDVKHRWLASSMKRAMMMMMQRW